MTEPIAIKSINASPPAVPFFDKVTIRTARFTEKDHGFLRANCLSVDVRVGHPIRGSNLRLIVTVICPNERALRYLAEQRRFVVNSVEVALDVILPNAWEPSHMVDFFDCHFLQPWHGKMQVEHYATGGFTTRKLPEKGERKHGHWFVGYGDKPSKVTDHPHCFHIEGRHQGMPALRRIGISGLRDLLTFDHAGYWARRLRFYRVDLEHLGRWYSNRRGQRRNRPRIYQCGSFKYNKDIATGSALYRLYALHPRQPQHPDDQVHRSIQQFVDRIKRGPFLRKLDASGLFNIVHIRELFI